MSDNSSNSSKGEVILELPLDAVNKKRNKFLLVKLLRRRGLVSHHFSIEVPSFSLQESSFSIKESSCIYCTYISSMHAMMASMSACCCISLPFESQMHRNLHLAGWMCLPRCHPRRIALRPLRSNPLDCRRGRPGRRQACSRRWGV